MAEVLRFVIFNLRCSEQCVSSCPIKIILLSEKANKKNSFISDAVKSFLGTDSLCMNEVTFKIGNLFFSVKLKKMNEECSVIKEEGVLVEFFKNVNVSGDKEKLC